MTAAVFVVTLASFFGGSIFGLLVGQRLQIRSCNRQGHNR